MGQGLGRGEVLQPEVSEDWQLRKGQLLIRVVGEFEIFASAFDVSSALRASVEPSPRAADKMLITQFLLTALPAQGLHHLRLFLGQRTILKRIHDLCFLVRIGSIRALQHQGDHWVAIGRFVHRSCGISAKAFLASTNDRIPQTG